MLFNEYGFRLYSSLETSFSLLFFPLAYPICFLWNLMTLLICFNENSIPYCFCDNSLVAVFMLLWPLHKPPLQLPLLPTQPECWVWSCVLCFLYSRGSLLYLWIQSLYSWDSKICIFSHFSTPNSYIHLWWVSLSG